MYTFNYDGTEEELKKRIKTYKDNVKKFPSTINVAYPREIKQIMKIVNENMSEKDFKINKQYLTEEKIIEGK